MVNSLARRALTTISAVALLTLAAGATTPRVFAATSAEIDIQNFSFVPSTLTVAPGTAVTWVNQDEEPHSVVNVGRPRVFRSLGIDGGEKYTFVFDQPGTYEYICSVHPHMHGTVIVK